MSSNSGDGLDLPSVFTMTYLWSDPLNCVKLNADREMFELEQLVVKECSSSMPLKLNFVLATKVNFDALEPCHVLHFSMHGNKGSVKMEAKDGLSDPCTVEELLTRMCSKVKPKLVFVCTCSSMLIGSKLSELGVDHVICSRK
jgi:hypothetical protein